MLINELVGAQTPYHMNMPVQMATRPMLEWGSTQSGKVKIGAIKMHDGLFHVMVYKQKDGLYEQVKTYTAPDLDSLSVMVKNVDCYRVVYISREMFETMMKGAKDKHEDPRAVEAIRTRMNEINKFNPEMVKADVSCPKRSRRQSYSYYHSGEDKLLRYNYNVKLLHKRFETQGSDDEVSVQHRLAAAVSPDPEFIDYKLCVLMDKDIGQTSYLSAEVCRLMRSGDQVVHFDCNNLWNISHNNLEIQLCDEAKHESRLNDMQLYLIEQIWPVMVSTRRLDLICATGRYGGCVYIVSSYKNGNTVYSSFTPESCRQLSGCLHSVEGARIAEVLRKVDNTGFKIYNGKSKDEVLEQLNFNLTLAKI
jgi:hypothetical protein